MLTRVTETRRVSPYTTNRAYALAIGASMAVVAAPQVVAAVVNRRR